MSLIPIRRHVLATTATAILAFMIVVPTVLHFVNPAFGQGIGAQGGYGPAEPPINYPPPTPANNNPTPATPPTPAGPPNNGNNGNTPPPTPATPSPTTPPTPANNNDNPQPPTPQGQPQNEQPAPAPAPEPEPTVVERDVGVLNPGAPITIDLRPAEALEPASLNPLVNAIASNPSVLKTDATVVANLLADQAALKAVIEDKASAEALLSSPAAVDQILDNPAALAAVASNADAAQALVSNAAVKAKLDTDAAFFEQVASAVLDQQHVSSIVLKANTAGSNVKLEVKEYLPTSKDQTAITSLGDAGLANIVLKVAAPQNVGSAPVSGTTAAEAPAETLYTPLKVLEISVSGVPKGSVGATVTFTVTQAELDLMGLDAANIALLHQSGGVWVALPTTLLSHVGSTYTFEAETPHFSYFAVAARATSAAVTAEGMSALAITGIVVAVLAVLVVAGIALSRRRQG